MTKMRRIYQDIVNSKFVQFTISWYKGAYSDSFLQGLNILNLIILPYLNAYVEIGYGSGLMNLLLI
jgi:hypothetical protein